MLAVASIYFSIIHRQLTSRKQGIQLVVRYLQIGSTRTEHLVPANTVASLQELGELLEPKVTNFCLLGTLKIPLR